MVKKKPGMEPVVCSYSLHYYQKLGCITEFRMKSVANDFFSLYMGKGFGINVKTTHPKYDGFLTIAIKSFIKEKIKTAIFIRFDSGGFLWVQNR